MSCNISYIRSCWKNRHGGGGGGGCPFLQCCRHWKLLSPGCGSRAATTAAAPSAAPNTATAAPRARPPPPPPELQTPKVLHRLLQRRPIVYGSLCLLVICKSRKCCTDLGSVRSERSRAREHASRVI